MKILLACEHYYPYSGGVAKYMQELGEGLTELGHNVSVATSHHLGRKGLSFSGITIIPFEISGNLVNGFTGDTQKYQDFLLQGDFELFIVMAAQQWTFDLVVPIIDKIRARMIHIPCGYSYLGSEKYEDFYEKVGSILHHFSALVFHSNNYKDIEFARKFKLQNIYVIPAGVNLKEFVFDKTIDIKKELNIPEYSFVFLNVGAPPFNKGQLELLKAYKKARFEFSTTLVLNSQYKTSQGVLYFFKECVKLLLGKSIFNIILSSKFIFSKNKKVILCNLKRKKLISLYFASDLFVLPSHIEYSPLVIFESMAAGVPYLVNPVGNCEEIIEWTKAGYLINDVTVKGEFKIADVEKLSSQLEILSQKKSELKALGARGKACIEEKFNWTEIIKQYLLILKKLDEKN